MKILFTSVGRRVELIQAFRDAAKKINTKLEIIGADVSPNAPALRFCDKIKIVCRIANSDYIPSLLKICEKERVDCLIPTIDTDLMLLSENKAEFEKIGTKVLVSSIEKVKLCRNKKLTTEYFNSIGLKSPFAFDKIEEFENELNLNKFDFPIFIKPKDGSSSINAYRVDDFEELKFCIKRVSNYIIQPYINGIEYTVDIFCDYNGNPIYITPRERLEIRAGEVSKTKIVQDDTIISEMLTLVDDFKPCGQITVQLIKDSKTGENFYIEINARFGGGAPLSIKAGADSAEAIIRMLNGETLEYSNKAAKDNSVFSRYDQSIYIEA